ncbi:hypothetical protein CDL12_18798 [Handroanthus impetiginosus]|uniref:Uncharacterized protein n=1 Tax=Handroanthus impetiginosus TaxID=429701 RepID=A0A2G9GTK7_9LAMI|nr:hypothetical protein CDL12_18798 [Handroanthus impetiginosus]
MRKGSPKMWWNVRVPCRSKKNLMRRESRMDIEEILKMKLETIKEEQEPELINEENGALTKQQQQQRSISNKAKKIQLKLFTSNLSLKDSSVLFMTGFASKGGLSGLPRCQFVSYM